MQKIKIKIEKKSKKMYDVQFQKNVLMQTRIKKTKIVHFEIVIYHLASCHGEGLIYFIQICFHIHDF